MPYAAGAGNAPNSRMVAKPVCAHFAARYIQQIRCCRCCHGIRLLLFLFVAFALSACAGRQAEVPEEAPYGSGQLVLPDGSDAAEDDFLRLAASSGYILLGERHDSALDHRVQARLLESLAKAGREPLLGLEMLPRQRYDGALAAFVRDGIALEDLPRVIGWKEHWGFDFALYKPVFETARQYGIPIYGLNIPNDLRRKVSAHGMASLSPSEQRRMPRTVVPPMPEQRQKLEAFFQKHAAMISARRAGLSTPSGVPAALRDGPDAPDTPDTHDTPGTLDSADPAVLAKQTPSARGERIGKPGQTGQTGQTMQAMGTVRAMRGRPAGQSVQAGGRTAFERFLLIQSLWDSTMAEAAAKIRQQSGKTGPVVILAGTGHVDFGYGIAYRLKVFDPSATSLLVVPFSDARPEESAADLFYYSPRSTIPSRGPAPGTGRGVSTARPGQGRTRLGIVLEQEGSSLRVVSVAAGSRADRAGIVAGDTIVRADTRRIAKASDLHQAAMEAGRSNRRLSIALQRQGEFLAVYVQE